MDTTTLDEDGLNPARHGAAGGADALGELVARVRRRWRLRRVLTGCAWALAIAGALLLGAAWVADTWHYAPLLITTLRLLLTLALAGLLLYFCVAPARRRVSDARVALYLEEHEPELRGIVVGAVDARDKRQAELSPQLVAGLIERAAAAAARVDFGTRVEARRLRIAGARVGAVALALFALALWAPPFLERAATALLLPWTGQQQYSPYRIEISPGDIEVARGSDQLISATIDGFDGEGVTLLTSADGGGSWQTHEMAFGARGGLYEVFLFDLGENLDYYVSGAGRESPIYRLTVADIPTIADLRLRYHYPDYTRLPPEEVVGSGDISALRGTRVEVLVTPSIDVPGGALVLGDGSRAELVAGDGGAWIGEILVEDNGSYSISLQRGSGVPVEASPEFRITALDDLDPKVSILSPGRDLKVSMIEEPLMKIRASDDQGIASLELVVSINGDDERVVELLRDGGAADAQREVAAEHVIYLEDLALRPGDLISYYVNARERAPADRSRTATSDIFFYQVRPFDASYRKSEQQGGGGGGGQQGGQQEGFLSDQQKQFVVATFKMLRDRDDYDAESWLENLDLLARAEARIRDRVEAIVRRIGRRAMIQADERYQVITEELPKAAERMLEVEQQLRAAEVEGALADAQVALKHLQRADAVFRDINVSMSNQANGNGRSSGAEDLANLFQLEMDKLRNQYDTVQRGQQQQSPEAVIDETLEKLRELAQRQQKEVERRLRGQGQVDSDEARERQLRLAQELEEMARQLERLSRLQPNPRLDRSLEQMRNAAEAMRRAAGEQQGGGQNSAEQAREAVASLQEAQRLLDQSKSARFGEALERTLRRAEMVERKQDAIEQDVTELAEAWGDEMKSQLEHLQERKRGLARDLENLENELGELSRDARVEQPEANESLKRAIQTARRDRLQERIRRTRQLLLLNERDKAVDNENLIRRGIESMRQDIQTALDNVTAGDERGLERSLEQMRAIARELQYLRERTERAQQEQQAQAGRPGQAAQPGQQERQGQQGQPAQQGQQGQPGRPGQSGQQARGGQVARGSQASADGEGGGFPFPQEIAGIAERSGQLRGALIRQGVDPGDIDPVLQKIDALTRGGASGPGAAQMQADALRALMELEYRLRLQLERHENPELLVSDSTELPEDYRDLVADYFRELSRQ